MTSSTSPTGRPHIVICGYGPGVGHAVASQFGGRGFAVSLIARGADKLDDAAAALVADGIDTAAVPADLSDSTAASAAIASAIERRGRLDVLHWNAVALGVSDVLAAEDADLDAIAALGLTAPIAAIRTALPHLRSGSQASVLLTGGGLAFDQANRAAVAQGMDGVALTKALQHKLFGLLASRLSDTDVFVGEVVIAGAVRAPWAPDAPIDATDVAGELFDLHTGRADPIRVLSGPQIG